MFSESKNQTQIGKSFIGDLLGVFTDNRQRAGRSYYPYRIAFFQFVGKQGHITYYIGNFL